MLGIHMRRSTEKVDLNTGGLKDEDSNSTNLLVNSS